MKDWDEILKEKLAGEEMTLPEGDWEWFELNKLQPFMRRRRLLRLCSSAAGLAVAASLAIIILHKTQEINLNSQTGILAESKIPVLSPDRVDRPEVVHINKPVVPPLFSSIESVPIQDIVIDSIEDNELAENQVPSDSLPTPAEIAKEEKIFPADVFINEEYKKPDNKHHLSLTPLVKGFSASRGYEHGISRPSVGSSTALPKTVSHNNPISIGLEINRELTSGLSVASGIDMSLYHSRYSNSEKSVIQSAYYLGIPLRLDWTVWHNGPVSVWFGGGGKVDRLVYGKFGTDRIKDDTLNWSIIGDLGIQYDLSKNVGVFLAPEVSYYFKPENPVIQTYRTENPLMFTVGAGLRFSL